MAESEPAQEPVATLTDVRTEWRRTNDRTAAMAIYRKREVLNNLPWNSRFSRAKFLYRMPDP